MFDDFDADGTIPQSDVDELIDASDLAMVVVGSVDPKPTIGTVDADEKEYQVSVKTFKVSQNE